MAAGLEGFLPSQVGRGSSGIVGNSVFEQYIMSLYFTVTLFSAIGDPDLRPETTIELVMTTLYLVSS